MMEKTGKKVMNNITIIKIKAVISIIIGLIIGTIWLFWNEIDNTPVLTLSAIVLWIIFLYFGLYNLNKLYNRIKPNIILPFFYGIIGIILELNYFIRGKYDEPPGIVTLGAIVSICLIAAGIINIKRNIKNKVT